MNQYGCRPTLYTQIGFAQNIWPNHCGCTVCLYTNGFCTNLADSACCSALTNDPFLHRSAFVNDPFLRRSAFVNDPFLPFLAIMELLLVGQSSSSSVMRNKQVPSIRHPTTVIVLHGVFNLFLHCIRYPLKNKWHWMS